MDRIKQLLGYQFMKLHFRLIEPLQEALRPLGITVKNFNMMELIDANPGISQNGLAEILEKDKTLIGQVLDKLEEKRLAKREPVKNDKRVYALSLTDEGKKIVAEYRHVVVESERALLASLSAEEEAVLRSLLNRLIQSGVVN